MPPLLPRSSFYRRTGDWGMDPQRATTALLHQFNEVEPSPLCSPTPRASITYPTRCMQHTWLRIRARCGKSNLAVSTPCVKVIHGPSLPRPHHYWLYTARGESGNRPGIKTNEAATGKPQGANPFNNSACSLVRPYPDDAQQRVRGRPGGFCRCNKPWVCCPTVHRHKIKIEAPA